MSDQPPIEEFLDEMVPEWREGNFTPEEVVVLAQREASKEMDRLLDFYNSLGKPCGAVIYHGPGHQSKTPCEGARVAHEIHQAKIVSNRTGEYVEVRWRGDEGITGYLDESPLEEE